MTLGIGGMTERDTAQVCGNPHLRSLQEAGKLAWPGEELSASPSGSCFCYKIPVQCQWLTTTQVIMLYSWRSETQNESH